MNYGTYSYGIDINSWICIEGGAKYHWLTRLHFCITSLFVTYLCHFHVKVPENDAVSMQAEN